MTILSFALTVMKYRSFMYLSTKKKQVTNTATMIMKTSPMIQPRRFFRVFFFFSFFFVAGFSSVPYPSSTPSSPLAVSAVSAPVASPRSSMSSGSGTSGILGSVGVSSSSDAASCRAFCACLAARLPAITAAARVDDVSGRGFNSWPVLGAPAIRGPVGRGVSVSLSATTSATITVTLSGPPDRSANSISCFTAPSGVPSLLNVVSMVESVTGSLKPSEQSIIRSPGRASRVFRVGSTTRPL